MRLSLPVEDAADADALIIATRSQRLLLRIGGYGES